MIGASDDIGTIRGRILEFLMQRNYQGALYLISGSQAQIRGKPTFRSIRDVRQPIDLALVAVRADMTEAVLRDCSEAGVKFAICFGSGFAEEGEAGRDMQLRLSELARPGGLRICGPNTAGFFNARGMIAATFTRSVDARRAAEDTGRLMTGTVGIVAQSGGLGFALQHRCAVQHGLGFSYIVSTGNEVDLEALDYVEYMIDDPDTRVVLLLVEGLKAAHRLQAVARRAAMLGKPIVVAKFGRTAAGSRAATSHAARLTGSDSGYEAAFRRHGLIRVEDEEEMTDLASAFSRCPLPQGNRVAIVTTSGGAGVWMADACETAGLEVPLLDDETQRALAEYVPSFGSTVNPVDLTAQVSLNPVGTSGKAASSLIGTLSILAGSPAIDAIVLVANLSDGQVLLRERDALVAFASNLRKPLFLYTHALPSAASLELLWQIGLTCFGSTRRTARTLKSLLDYAMFLRRSRETDYASPTLDGMDLPLAFPPSGLCEYEAKAVLRQGGIDTPRERLACSASEAVAAAAAFGQAVALKIQSPQIPHKTEMNGVILNASGEAEIRNFHAELLERAKRFAPDAQIHGILVQEMVPKGLEVALGIVRDRDFGPLMMVGLGGIHIEVLNDVVYELLPVRHPTALAMLQRLRSRPLLMGVRGEAARDVEALAELMERLSLLVERGGDRINEIDLNPVYVYEAGRGVAVVDAFIVGSN
ncbi:MAG: acetate--CoA ligase family protein [Betaproteobacteria bacterium]|nr:acetate--CoA ligase family protein [Betaproteobacteria bacterium]